MSREDFGAQAYSGQQQVSHRSCVSQSVSQRFTSAVFIRPQLASREFKSTSIILHEFLRVAEGPSTLKMLGNLSFEW